MTIGDYIAQVLAITTPEEARAFYAADVERNRNAGAADPEGCARAKDKDRRAMWREVCGASHPALGDMVENPDPADVLAAGLAHGEALRRRQEGGLLS